MCITAPLVAWSTLPMNSAVAQWFLLSFNVRHHVPRVLTDLCACKSLFGGFIAPLSCCCIYDHLHVFDMIWVDLQWLNLFSDSSNTAALLKTVLWHNKSLSRVLFLRYISFLGAISHCLSFFLIVVVLFMYQLVNGVLLLLDSLEVMLLWNKIIRQLSLLI